MLSYLKDLFTKKRVAASHVLVFMIADELRNRKPYAVPVQFMPYKSLTDSKLRELEVQLEDAMRNAGMTVVGMYEQLFLNYKLTHISRNIFNNKWVHITAINLCSTCVHNSLIV